MKKLLLSPIILLCFFACEQKAEIELGPDEFRVYGTVKGLDSDFMLFDGRDAEGGRIFDTIWVKNESFDYTGKVYELSHLNIWPQIKRVNKWVDDGKAYIPTPSAKFQFFAQEGDQIEFTGKIGDFVDAYPSGSSANEGLAKLNKQTFPLTSKGGDLIVQWEEEKDTTKHAAIQAIMEETEAELLEQKRSFIKSHPNSTAAAWALLDMTIRSEVEMEEIISLFEGLDRNSLAEQSFYLAMDQRIEGYKKTAVGQPVPNFEARDAVNGNSFSMKALRGKYVLIDFWGIWCGPCVKEMPKIKSYQEKYADDLVVVGINQGDSEKRIKDFVAKNEYAWTQIMEKEADLVAKFSVAGFPTKLLIDPEGEIIHRQLGNEGGILEVLDKRLSGENS
ncbi:MAG: TlpA disulfide reductase family protein [Bacteroidia bacterium]|nr:TlpA disulfide reductase family protein [Bacteroidia bacterium]